MATFPADFCIAGGDRLIQEMTIRRFECGIRILVSGHSGIEKNLIGTDINGTTAIPTWIGARFDDFPDNWVGGTWHGDGNVISGKSRAGFTCWAWGRAVESVTPPSSLQAGLAGQDTELA